MAEKVIRVPANIPLIGQGPTPEQMEQAKAETLAVFQTWPTHAYPTGPNAGPFWGGETMIHRYAGMAMEAMRDQFAAKSRSDAELIALCQKCWKIAILMMRTSPFSPERQNEKPAEKPRPDPSTTADNEVGKRFLTNEEPAPVEPAASER